MRELSKDEIMQRKIRELSPDAYTRLHGFLGDDEYPHEWVCDYVELAAAKLIVVTIDEHGARSLGLSLPKRINAAVDAIREQPSE